jgi:hypothetical protein
VDGDGRRAAVRLTRALQKGGRAVDLLRKQSTSYRRAIICLGETLDHGSQGKHEDALRAIDDTTTYSLGFSTTEADMKHDADEFNSDLTTAPTRMRGMSLVNGTLFPVP